MNHSRRGSLTNADIMDFSERDDAAALLSSNRRCSCGCCCRACWWCVDRCEILQELVSSADLVVRGNKVTLLLPLGVVALVGNWTGMLGEAMCFMLAGLALIPCAER